MINKKKVIAIIPARGGSKTIPYKNIKLLLDKPLIAWTIETAKKTKEIDRVVVSTDDEKIAQIAVFYGAEVIKRPKYLAEDDSLPIDVVKHLIQELKKNGDDASIMVYLEPTSPLREEDDIKKSLQLLVDERYGYHSVASFVEASLHPYRAWKCKHGAPIPFIENISFWLPRQKLPRAFELNGSVYSFWIDRIKANNKHFLSEKIGAFIMPKERSIDIDDELDFLLAETLMRRKKEDGQSV